MSSKFLELLQAEVEKDASFLEFSSSSAVPVPSPQRLLPVGEKIKTLRALEAGQLKIRKGAVGKVIGASKTLQAYVASFDGSVVYVSPCVVAKASSTKDKTSVNLKSVTSRKFRINERVIAKSSWGFLLNKVGEGEVLTVVNNSAGNFGSFEPMLVVRSSADKLYMIPEACFESVAESPTSKSLDFSEDDYHKLDGDIDTGVAEATEFEASEGGSISLEEPRAMPQPKNENSKMLEIIHKLEEMVDPGTFRKWLYLQKDVLSAEALAFGEQLIQLWGHKLGVVFSYPVAKNMKCASSLKTPFVYRSKLCESCVSRNEEHCMKHSASLLSDKQIATTSDYQFLRMITKGPIGFQQVFSSLEDYVKKEVLGKVRIKNKSSLELQFDPDLE